MRRPSERLTNSWLYQYPITNSGRIDFVTDGDDSTARVNALDPWESQWFTSPASVITPLRVPTNAGVDISRIDCRSTDRDQHISGAGRR